MKPCVLFLVLLGLNQALNCPLGSQQVGDQCEQCLAGTFDQGDNTCQTCPGGTFSAVGGSTACLECPIRTHSADNKTMCLPCTNGHFADTTGNEECIPCAAGYFTDKTGSLSCEPCPVGQYQDKAGFDFCYPCPEGKFADVPGTAECAPCPIHTYLDQENQEICKKCPSGTDTLVEGQTSCSPCEVGTFGDVPGESCKQCAQGTFTNTTGATLCQGCSKGYYNRDQGQTECKACPIGQFQNLVGQARCEPCPPRTHGDREGLDYCDFCPAGTFSKGSGNSECTLCPAGFYTDKEGEEECRPCPPGFYQDEAGQSSCKPCSAGSAAPNEGSPTCDICQPGSYSSIDKAVTCELCGQGYYQAEEGQQQCKSCLWGKTTKSVGATQPSQCFWERCPPGFRFVGGEEMCKACKPGSYSDHMDSKECTLCSLGTYTEFERASFCDSCPKTHFTYTTGSDSKSDCQGPVLVGYTMKNFGGRKIEVYDTTYKFTEIIYSVRVLRGDWHIYSNAYAKGYHKFVSEGGEFSDLQMILNYNGALSATTQVNDEFCYTERGAKYTGNRDYTVSGRSCQMWNSSHPHEHDHGLSECLESDFGLFTNEHKIQQRTLQSELACKEWCDETPKCRAIAISPKTWAHRECFLVSTVAVGKRQGWSTALKSCWNSEAVRGRYNYCRNPGNKGDRPWCFTNDPDTRWEYCDVPKCVWNRDCVTGDGSQYRGSVNKAASGHNCQNWESNFPHPHGYHSDGYSGMGIGKHNMCRNPSGQTGAWCYTTNLFERWGFCRIPRCNTSDFPYYDQK